MLSEMEKDMNINFDTENLTTEEAKGLKALLDVLTPSLLSAEGLRAHRQSFYSSAAQAATAVQPAIEEAEQDPAPEQPAVTNTPRAGESEDQTKARTRTRKKAEDKPQISTEPENRVGPEDTPEVQEQDKADEKAEVEASRNPEKPLTRDDVKTAMYLYVNRFGMDAAGEDGHAIFSSVLGAPPADAKGWSISRVPETQDAFEKAISAWTEAAQSAERYKKVGA
jgi:hypothetical protein